MNDISHKGRIRTIAQQLCFSSLNDIYRMLNSIDCKVWLVQFSLASGKLSTHLLLILNSTKEAGKREVMGKGTIIRGQT